MPRSQLTKFAAAQPFIMCLSAGPGPTAGCTGAAMRAALGTATTLTDGSGTNFYANDMLCTWTITSSLHQATLLVFSQFALEAAAGGVCHDHVRVYDGMTMAAPVIATLCGSQLPRALMSTGPLMLVEFRTDSSIVNLGFTAQYLGGG